MEGEAVSESEFESQEIRVHATGAWVVVSRDEPLAVMTMSFGRANKLQADIRKALLDKGIPLESPDPPREGGLVAGPDLKGLKVCRAVGHDYAEPVDGVEVCKVCRTGRRTDEFGYTTYIPPVAPQ